MFDWALGASRLLQFASILVLFGSSLFYLYGLNGEAAGTLAPRRAWPRHVLLVAALIATVGTVSWLMAETALMSGDAHDALRWGALQSVVSETRFGQVGLLRATLIMVSLAFVLLQPAGRKLWIAQTVLGGLLVASFAWTGHGSLNDGFPGVIHRSADVLHLLAASVWIGALVPLSLLIERAYRTNHDMDAHAAMIGLERFSGIGFAVVATLVSTGLINSWFLIGLARWRDVLTTAYGLSLLVKLLLFAGMLVLAGANRFRFSPRLNLALSGGERPALAFQRIRASVLTETALSVMVLAVVALLGTLEPPVSR